MNKQSLSSRSLTLGITIARCNAELARRLDRRLGGLHGLSFVDLTVLTQLNSDASGRMRRVDLAEKLGLTQSAVTRILAPLERIGLVSRHADPNDARVGYAALSKTGRTILAEATETAEIACDEVFVGLTHAEFDAVNTVLKRIIR